MIKRKPDPFVILAVVLVIGVLASVMWMETTPDGKDVERARALVAEQARTGSR